MPFNKTPTGLVFLAVKEPELLYCWRYEVSQLLVHPRDIGQLSDLLHLVNVFQCPEIFPSKQIMF